MGQCLELGERRSKAMKTPTERFKSFIESVKDQDYLKIIQLAETEHATPSPKKPTKDARLANVKYHSLVTGFLFSMRYGMKPAGVDAKHFQMFRPVCKSLVQRKQLKAEVMKLFK
jgi:hypothetical protein